MRQKIVFFVLLTSVKLYVYFQTHMMRATG